jgi:hypothetical protein
LTTYDPTYFINTRFGERKLLEIDRSELKREPRVNELFLFYNVKRDTLKKLEASKLSSIF